MAPSPQRLCRRRGSQAVEFALTLPVLVGLVMGCIDYGWYIQKKLKVDSLVWNAARAASIAAINRDHVAVAQDFFIAELELDGLTPLDNGALVCQGAIDTLLVFSGSVAFEPIIGIVPLPTTLHKSATLALTNPPPFGVQACP